MCLGDLVLDVVVHGGAAVDVATDVAGSIRFRRGGSAANTARAFAALGGHATFVGAVGADPLGKLLAGDLRAAGVTVRAISVRGRTARLIALVGPGGERSFVTDRGAADSLRPAAIDRSWLRHTDALHLPAYSLLAAPLADAALLAVERVRAAGGLISVDLASRRPLIEAGIQDVHALLARIAPDVLLANADEAATLTGRHVRRLLDLAPVVVIKQGDAGCSVQWRAASGVLAIDVATKPISATDTTGAGDAFDAGFMHALLVAGHQPGAAVRAALMRRAALAGHRAASRLIGAPRPELAL